MQTLDAPHPGMRLGWSEMTLVIDGRADVPLRHLIVRQENKVLAAGRAAQAGERSDVLAGGTYWSWGRGVNNRRSDAGHGTAVYGEGHSTSRAGRLWTLCTIEIEVA